MRSVDSKLEHLLGKKREKICSVDSDLKDFLYDQDSHKQGPR